MNVTAILKPTPWSRVLPEKLTSPQLVKKLPALYETGRFIRIHNNPPTVPILSQSIPVHASPFYLLKIHFNLNLPPKARSSKWSSSFPRVSSKSCVQLYCPPNVPHVPPISFFFISSCELHFVRGTEHTAPHYVVFTFLLPPSQAQISS